MFPFPLFRFDDENAFLKILFYLIIIIFFIVLYKYYIARKKALEGFTQDDKFILKKNNDIYDPFYVEFYDKLTDTNNRTKHIIDSLFTHNAHIFQLKGDDIHEKAEIAILDIGCGTGSFVNDISNKGFNISGVDKSPAMIHYSELMYPKNTFIQKDIETQTLITNGYTHIFSLYMTIYEINDKDAFFKNIYQSLQPNGILIIELIDFTKYDVILPLARTNNNINEPNLRKFMLSFDGVTYKRDWTNPVVIKETITDNETGKIRQNENNLSIESFEYIIALIKQCGFSDYNVDPVEITQGQFLYFFIKKSNTKIPFRKNN